MVAGGRLHRRLPMTPPDQHRMTRPARIHRPGQSRLARCVGRDHSSYDGRPDVGQIHQMRQRGVSIRVRRPGETTAQ
jgi:hypothetical protein